MADATVCLQLSRKVQVAFLISNLMVNFT